MSNKALLTIIIILLLGIGAVLIFQINQETPAEQFSDSISEASDDVGDAIEDAVEANN